MPGQPRFFIEPDAGVKILTSPASQHCCFATGSRHRRSTEPALVPLSRVSIVCTFPTCNDVVFIFCEPAHYLSNTNSLILPYGMLVSEPFILPMRHNMLGLYGQITQVCRQAGFTPRAVQ